MGLVECSATIGDKHVARVRIISSSAKTDQEKMRCAGFDALVMAIGNVAVLFCAVLLCSTENQHEDPG